MKTPFLFAIVTSVLVTGCGDKGSGSSAETNTASSVITAPVDYLGAVAQAQKHAVSTVDTVSITHAIQLFQTEEGRYPKDLNELVQQKYLPKLPTPAYGTKFEYDPASGQVKVVQQ